MVVLESKDAEWDKALNSYVLNYHGRASQVGMVVMVVVIVVVVVLVMVVVVIVVVLDKAFNS